MTKPKIKDTLPEKQQMIVSEEKIGKPIEEDFIEENQEGPEQDPDPAGPTTEEVLTGVTKNFNEEETELYDPSAKPAQPDKYPSHAGKAPHQLPLHGEADMILNALEVELFSHKEKLKTLHKQLDTLNDKIFDERERVEILSEAVNSQRKLAPMIEIPEDQPEPETTSSSGDEAPKDPISGVDEDHDANGQPNPPKAVAPGAAERAVSPEDKLAIETTTKEEIAAPFRNPTQPIPEVLFLGDIIETSWNTGPYRIEEIIGPFSTTENLQDGGMMDCPEHWSLKCSDVDAKRNKDGRLPKNYEYPGINLVVAVGNRFLSLFAASEDEIMLIAEPIDKNKDAPQSVVEPKAKEPTAGAISLISDEDLF